MNEVNLAIAVGIVLGVLLGNCILDTYDAVVARKFSWLHLWACVSVGAMISFCLYADPSPTMLALLPFSKKVMRV